MKVAEKWTPAEYAELQKLSKAATKEAFRNGLDKFKEAAKKERNRTREKEKYEALAAHVTLHVNDGQEAVYRDMARVITLILPSIPTYRSNPLLYVLQNSVWTMDYRAMKIMSSATGTSCRLRAARSSDMFVSFMALALPL